MGKLGEDKLINYFKQTNKKHFNLKFEELDTTRKLALTKIILFTPKTFSR